MAETTVHSTRIPTDLYEKLRIIAEMDGRSLNGDIVVLIRRRVTEYERDHGPVILPGKQSP